MLDWMKRMFQGSQSPQGQIPAAGFQASAPYYQNGVYNPPRESGAAIPQYEQDYRRRQGILGMIKKQFGASPTMDEVSRFNDQLNGMQNSIHRMNPWSWARQQTGAQMSEQEAQAIQDFMNSQMYYPQQ